MVELPNEIKIKIALNIPIHYMYNFCEVYEDICTDYRFWKEYTKYNYGIQLQNIVVHNYEEMRELHIILSYPNNGLISAVQLGYTELFPYLIDKGATTLNEALINASVDGNLDVINKLITSKPNFKWNLDEALMFTSTFDNIEVLKYLLDIAPLSYYGYKAALAAAGIPEVYQLIEDKWNEQTF